jgi:hypothetical protein
VSERPVERDVKLLARLTILQNCPQQFTEEQFEAHGVEPSMRAALLDRDRYPESLGFGSELAPHGARDGTNRYILSGGGRKQGHDITEVDTNQILERLRVPGGHGSEAGISARLEWYAVVVHQSEHALDRSKRSPEIVTKVAKAIA